MSEQPHSIAVYLRIAGSEEYEIGSVTDSTASLAALLRAAADEAERLDED